MTDSAESDPLSDPEGLLDAHDGPPSPLPPRDPSRDGADGRPTRTTPDDDREPTDDA